MNRKTSLITAAAVGGALLAGTGAIAANIGVLSAADDDSIGNLSAEAPVSSPEPTGDAQVVDVYIEDPPAAGTGVAPTTLVEVPAAVGQQFDVEAAGAVTVEQTPTGLFVSDVRANDGWTWSTTQSSSNELTVTFVSGDITYEFSATVNANGIIEARVDQPIVDVVHVPSPAPAPSVSSSNSSRGDDGGHDDDRDDDEHDDHEEDDDDHYEGGDDDD